MVSPLAITTEALSRSFGSVRAVQDLSISVPAGTVFGFLGPNGAGKTTTIRLLLGLIEASRGTARVLGFDPRTDADQIRMHSGALLEHPGVYERLSGMENLEFYGRIWQIPAADRRARARELLTRFGLWERRTEPAGRWSRGMKQKLALARALMHRPRLVFLDEPTAGLDPEAAASLRSDIQRLAHAEGTTVFLTTHNLAEAERICDRVGILRAGLLLRAGAPADVCASLPLTRLRIRVSDPPPGFAESVRMHPGVSRVVPEPTGFLVELLNGADDAALTADIRRNGAEITPLGTAVASLEDAYLSLVRQQ